MKAIDHPLETLATTKLDKKQTKKLESQQIKNKKNQNIICNHLPL
jgi:hypothetical protein